MLRPLHAVLLCAVSLTPLLFSVPAAAVQPMVESPDPLHTRLPLMQNLAEQGCAEDQRILGGFYRRGNYGADANMTEALKWFQRAAAQDDWEAQVDIGDILTQRYEQDPAVKPDYEEAYFWYSLAFTRGHAVNVSWFTEKPHRIDANLSPEQKAAVDQRVAAWKPVHEIRLMPHQSARYPDEPSHWTPADILRFRKRADKGDPYAAEWLGDVYHYGWDMKPNPAEALSWYRKAAAQGEFGAIKFLGKMYAAGDGVPQDWPEAWFWTRITASCDEEDQGFLSEIAAHLTKAQLEDGKKRVDAWFAAPIPPEPPQPSPGDEYP